MVKTITIVMETDEFFKVLELKKRLSSGDPVMTWREYLLLKRVNGNGKRK